MKKNNDTPTLEQLLASVEHAGRDARRQQQLSEMIERMAAEDASKRHRNVRLWTVRFAAAATVTLFVVTLVWKLANPSLSAGVQVAQAPVVRKTKLPVPTMEPLRQAVKAPDKPLNVPVSKHQSTVAMPVLEEQPIVAEAAAVEPVPVFPVMEEAIAEAVVQEEPMPTVEEEEPVVTDIEPAVMAQSSPTPKPKQERRSFFSLFRAEPSLMDGTMLAFNIL